MIKSQKRPAKRKLLERMDVWAGARLASYRKHPLIRSCCAIGKIGDQEPLYILGTSMVAWGAIGKNMRLIRAGFSLIAAVAVADASKSLIKRFVTRSRPHHLLDDGQYEREAGGSERKCKQSFPSGHVAGSVAAARAVSQVYPQANLVSTAAVALLGATRLLKGAHWPLDVAAGIFVGLAAERISRKLMAGWPPVPIRRHD